MATGIMTFGPGTTPLNGGSLPAEVRQGYDAKLLRAAMPALVHSQFCEDKPIDKHQGNTLNTVSYTHLLEPLVRMSPSPQAEDKQAIVARVMRDVQSANDYRRIIEPIIFESLAYYRGAQNLRRCV